MLSEVNPPTSASGMAGLVFISTLLLAGVWKCWSISRRPTTNAKCALALMFVLLAIFFASCVGVLVRIFGASPGLLVVSGLGGLVMMVFLVAAFVVAILGLVEFSKQRSVYTQGQAQAIWALVLTGMTGLLVLAGFVTALTRSQGFAPAAGQDQAGQVLTFDDFNFRFRTPGRPWVSVNALNLNKFSKLTLMRRFPEAYFLIIPEKIGTRVDLSTEQLAEAGEANLQAAATSYRVIRETPLDVNGLHGLLVETEAQVGAYRLHYRHWYCATNGYAYQLVGYSQSDDQVRVAHELEEMLSRFELIDPNRMASVVGNFITNYVSPDHNYSVIVTNSAWHAFASLGANFPRAEFGASQGDSCFAVEPVWLKGEKLDMEALASAFLATMDISYSDEHLSHRKLITESDLEGVQYDFSREVNGQTFRYRLRILEGHDEGYLVAAWTQRRMEDADTILNDALGRVRFIAPPNSHAPLSAEKEMTNRERKTGGFVLNQAGLFHMNQGGYEKALPLFCAAARANSEESIYALNALDAWQRLDRPKEALAFLDAQPPAILAVPAVRARQAHFQAQASLIDKSITNYAGLFASGYRDDSYFTEYINLLTARNQYDLALAEVQKYLNTEDSVAARLLEAQIYRQKQDLPKAINLLKQLRDNAPSNSQVASALAEAFIQAGQFSEALAISKELLKDNVGSAYGYYLKGRSELGLKWYREAKTSFADAARMAPANKDIRSYLDYVSGLLGEGDNTAIMDPIEPVALPAALTNLSTESVPDGYAKSYGAYYIRRVVAASYVLGKEYKTTEFILARMLDASGVSAFSTVQVAFDPLGEQIYVNEVRVTDAAGRTVSTGNAANYYVLDDRSAMAASQKKILNIPVPGLQPGCQLAATVTRRQLGKLDEFPFLAHSFACTAPARESIFFLAGDAHGLKYNSSPPVEPKKLPEGLCWRVMEPMVARWEPLQPPGASFLPMLWISDASARWSDVTSNYLASINDRLELDTAFRDQTRELVRKLDTADAKMAALASYVQTNLTYKAIEFGRHARTPNKPADIIRNKYGDCKDHAVLLQQMLGAAGIPAQLALVSSTGPVRKDMPSIDQFDHMIVYVAATEGARFLDCTSKGADVANAIPYGLAGHEALVLGSGNSRFVSVPNYPVNASSVSINQHFRLADIADLVVEEALTLTGIHAALMRDYLLQIPESSRRTMLQTQMEMTDAELTDTKIDSLDERGKPLVLHFTYTLKNQFHLSNDRLTGILRAGFARSYLAASPVENRLTPFEIKVPLSFQSTAEVDIPPGFHAEKPEALDLKLDPRFADAQGEARIENQKLNLEFSCHLSTGEFDAFDYAAYRKTMANALSLLERQVVFKANSR